MKFLKGLAKFLVMLLLSVPTSLFGGYVFSKMWSWFIVSRFGVPALTALEGVGVIIVASFLLMPIFVMLVKQQTKKENPEMSDFALDTIMAIIMLALVYPCLLAMASIWHHVIG